MNWDAPIPYDAEEIAELAKVCEICGEDIKGHRKYPRALQRKAQLDHCHFHKHIRGLLCQTCNTGLWRLLKKVNKIGNKARQYVLKYRCAVDSDRCR